MFMVRIVKAKSVAIVEFHLNRRNAQTFAFFFFATYKILPSLLCSITVMSENTVMTLTYTML